ncbi:hypothetical protein KO494_09180 [Lacinutrix sp. C3R15]|uniref:hypothetical protein n=1 Tax=Flavobacteriaceae TaxID=49546 RepID=UPI001C08624B|nr:MULTISPECIES: hypothetical protein [Flavobacteriaceae]MBU2939709.1 hypothetical protein [Lacinutrix sp. C3R15]MDO6623024.1 hypothetical protein [Oceanihabitans sp. 1_MG-2023]
MKKLLVIALALVTIQVSAQEKREGRQRKADFSPEEIAQLQTKQMTLDLDLTDEQQEKIGAINLENAIARKAKMEARKKSDEKPSKEEMLKMKNERLDAQIETKRKMKSILNEEQYAKWEKTQGKRSHMQRKGKKEMRDGEPKDDE